jgi:hypothetical protein
MTNTGRAIHYSPNIVSPHNLSSSPFTRQGAPSIELDKPVLPSLAYPALAPTMSTTTTFPFPHPVLTAIVGKPTARTIKQLRKEIYANARSVHSARGGGLHGHLGITMTVATYTVRAGQPFQEPDHPGPQPEHAAAATSAQIGATNRAYDDHLEEFRTYAAVKENIRQQILTAMRPYITRPLRTTHSGTPTSPSSPCSTI